MNSLCSYHYFRGEERRNLSLAIIGKDIGIDPRISKKNGIAELQRRDLLDASRKQMPQTWVDAVLRFKEERRTGTEGSTGRIQTVEWNKERIGLVRNLSSLFFFIWEKMKLSVS